MMARKNDEYSKLKRSIFSKLIIIIVLSFVMVLFAINIFKGNFCHIIISFIVKIGRVRYEDALNLYEIIFRKYSSVFILLFLIFTVNILLYFLVLWLKKYFDLVNDGIDALIERRVSCINMPPEMKFLEEKLRHVQETLINQEEKRKEAERKKDELVMYLAHDIRTPLTSVLGYLNILNDADMMSEEERKKYTQIALKKAERLETLINEFFEITCYNQNNIVLEKEEIDLYYLLVQLIDEVYPQAEKRGKKIRLEADENISAYANAEKLARAFLNILRNAIYYGKNDTDIIIYAQKKEKGTCIQFCNYGDSLTKEEQDKIFEKFYRMDEARQTNTGGAGIGLAIADNIMKLHGGKIHVTSQDGKIIFHIWIPDAYDL